MLNKNHLLAFLVSAVINPSHPKKLAMCRLDVVMTHGFQALQGLLRISLTLLVATEEAVETDDIQLQLRHQQHLVVAKISDVMTVMTKQVQIGKVAGWML